MTDEPEDERLREVVEEAADRDDVSPRMIARRIILVLSVATPHRHTDNEVFDNTARVATCEICEAMAYLLETAIGMNADSKEKMIDRVLPKLFERMAEKVKEN